MKEFTIVAGKASSGLIVVPTYSSRLMCCWSTGSHRCSCLLSVDKRVVVGKVRIVRNWRGHLVVTHT